MTNCWSFPGLRQGPLAFHELILHNLLCPRQRPLLLHAGHLRALRLEDAIRLNESTGSTKPEPRSPNVVAMPVFRFRWFTRES